jgi:hypothetical protein
MTKYGPGLLIHPDWREPQREPRAGKELRLSDTFKEPVRTYLNRSGPEPRQNVNPDLFTPKPPPEPVESFYVLNLDESARWLSAQTGMSHGDSTKALVGERDGVPAAPKYGTHPIGFRKDRLAKWHEEHAGKLHPVPAIKLSELGLLNYERA